MKKLINILFTLLLAVVATSCLENGLEELDTYTDCDNNTFYIRYVTGNLPADQVSAFTTSKVVIAVTISTAAVIKPIDGAPTLGVPGDWSKPNKYEVMAANGDKKVWTIVVEPYQN